MPYQNRVDPYGQLRAVKDRGAWMGNRGILHNDAREIVAQWRLKRWITCHLSFKDRYRRVFTPHRYSELFFLDEATAFAAGHRPCAECRRQRYNEFREAWSMANPQVAKGEKVRADDIDRQLHLERALRGGGKQSYQSNFGLLPSGTFIDRNGAAQLLWHGALYPWTFAGYGAQISMPASDEVVRVLTPASIVAAFNQGFVPQVHESISLVRKR
ncbi:MAG TPA: hypothetical protein VKB46_21600 [Pyrinomonadaceae bacterium]|nr:hypothetical protein [Pyrinomonadaceae bacterium]